MGRGRMLNENEEIKILQLKSNGKSQVYKLQKN